MLHVILASSLHETLLLVLLRLTLISVITRLVLRHHSAFLYVFVEGMVAVVVMMLV